MNQRQTAARLRTPVSGLRTILILGALSFFLGSRYSVLAASSTIWPSTTVPGTVDSGPDSSVELGVKFRSDVSGTVTGIRFYKATANTGSHIGNLWSATGTLLASGTFSNETASGWQQVNFATPVNITSNTVYVTSYHANNGHYSADQNYFAGAGVDNPPLHALADGVSGPNSVYAYGATSAFPNQTWLSANYWVDLVFQTGPPPTLSSISVAPTNPSIVTAGSQQFTATGTFSDNSTQNLTAQVSWISSNTVVATISSAGLATGNSVGAAVISATLSNVTGSTILTVKAPPTLTSIAVTPANPTNSVGATQQFTATGTYSDNSTSNLTSRVTWASTVTSIATINTGGLSTSVSAGSATISATLTGLTGTTTLTVKAPPTLTSIAVTPANPTNSVGATQQFTATGTYSDSNTSNLTAVATWRSSATAVATVSSTGLATSVSPGTSTISASLTGITNGTVMTVKPSPLVITTAALPNGTLNLAYSTSLTATAGTTPYTWVVSSGTLPSGLSLATAGTITGTPTAAGAFNFTVRVTDSSSPAQTTNKPLSITISSPSTAVSIWSSNTVPATPDSGPDSSVELGVKFQSDVAGNIAGIRFYKSTANTGNHVANLWTTSGTLLASAIFSNETASGWQQVNFASPVTISSNTVYVASYHLNSGHYAADIGYFSGKGVDNPPLHALADGVAGGDGCYAYGTTSSLPTSTWNSANYYVDVAFQAAAPATLNSIALTPANPSILAGTTQQFTATGTYSDSSTRNLTTQVTWVSSNTVVATINSAGFATGASAGTAPISAILTGVSGSTVLTVRPLPTLTSITVTPANPTNLVGATQQFTATGTYSDNNTQNLTAQVTWSSSNTAVATISSSGLATSVSAGTAPMWASLSGVSGTTTLIVKAPPSLTSIAVTPANPTNSVGATQQFTATGTYTDGSSSNLTASVTWGSSKTSVGTISSAGLATSVSTGTSTISAASGNVAGTTLLTVRPAPLVITTTTLPNGTISLSYSVTLNASGGIAPYSWSLPSGSLPSGLALTASTGSITGVPTSTGSFSFTAQVSDSGSPAQTTTQALSITISPASSVPILVLTNSADPFSQFYAEILSTEGLNEFNQTNLASITSASLASYDVVILGQASLTSSQVTMLTSWVNAGGKLIAIRPDKQLASLLGVTDAGSTLSEGYLLVNSASGPGAGIVNQTVQFHGTADRYTVAGASSLATLYSSAQTATANPAVTIQNVGNNGGQAVAFTYDLARSIVFTRQGNPAWAGQERDAQPPIRADDLYFGAASFDPEPDYVDFTKIAIPQADEQQRLLANLVLFMDSTSKLLPRFWYFPQGFQAVLVMTGDDHANGGTAGRFNQYTAMSPNNASVADWQAIRSTSYIYPSSLLNNSQASSYNAAGFEIGMHLNTGCADWTRSTLSNSFSQQMATFKSTYPSLPTQQTHRIHCLVWSDYSSAAEISRAFGIRMDVSYYYWPSNWIQGRPGLFTGSGMPMRFVRTNGVVIDLFEAPTQMTDESGESYPYVVDGLLDKAVGPEGYYGAFVANMHTDFAASPGSDAIISSALSRGVPIVSSLQMLTWLDARNASTLRSVGWSNNKETFSVQAAPNARGLQAMAPVPAGYTATSVKLNGNPVAFTLRVVKGVQYAFFPAQTGNYEVTVAPDSTAPAISGFLPSNGATGVSPLTNVLVSFSKAMNVATLTTNTFTLRDSSGNLVPATIFYSPTQYTAVVTPVSPLGLSKTYTATIKGGSAGVADTAGNILPGDFVWSFTTTNQIIYTIWPANAVPATPDSGPDSSLELGVRFQSDVAGTVTGISFYKAAANTGTHVGNLWNSSGKLLASATFSSETASGWQQVLFSSPVAITSNTVYVASYHANNGHYSGDQNYFAGAGVDNPPLHALSNPNGGNGVYRYGTTSAFPNSTFASENYWVDLVFKPQ